MLCHESMSNYCFAMQAACMMAAPSGRVLVPTDSSVDKRALQQENSEEVVLDLSECGAIAALLRCAGVVLLEPDAAAAAGRLATAR